MKKLALSFLPLLILSTSFATVLVPSARAAEPELGPWYNQKPMQWFVKVFDANNPQEIFGERYTYAQVQWIIYSIAAFFLSSQDDLITCTQTGDAGACVTGGATNFSKFFATIDSPEQSTIADLAVHIFNQDRGISFIGYTRHIAQNMHIIPEASAQTGFGYSSGLQPLQALWGASRNLSYTFFILLIMAMSLMIMFRVRLSPQTVVSIQSALPKVVISLVLVTFSFAIAGLMVDLMYVATGLMAASLSQSGVFFPNDPVNGFDFFTNGGMQFAGFQIQLGLLGVLVAYGFLFAGVLVTTLFSSQGILGLMLAIPLAPFALVLAVVIGIILVIVLLIAGMRALWTLTKCFAMLVVLTIVAPVQIALGLAMPGNKAVGFGAWLRAYISNLAPFPVIGLLMALAFILLNQAANLSFGSFLGFSGIVTTVGTFFDSATAWPPLLGSGGDNQKPTMAFVLLVTSVSIILLIPKAADIIKSFITGGSFAYGTAVGQAMAPVSQPAGMLARGGAKSGLESVGTTAAGWSTKTGSVISQAAKMGAGRIK